MKFLRKIYLIVFVCFFAFPILGQNGLSIEFNPEESLYLLTSTEATFNEIVDSTFKPKDYYPELKNRKLDKAIWIKAEFMVEEHSSIVMNFLRKDYVDLYVLKEGVFTDHSQTGFLLPSSQKRMQRWNAIDLMLQSHKKYTFYIRILNTVNDVDLNIKISERNVWKNKLLYGIIKNIAFLSLTLIISVYFLLNYFQNKSNTYLHLSLYLLVIFLFYAFILDILRDFFIMENPHETLYIVSLALLGPTFYYGFARNYLNTKDLIPKWNSSYVLLGKVNIGVFVIAVIIFFITSNYYFLIDIVRISLSVNIIAGLILVFLLWGKKNPLLPYYIIGSSFMLISTGIDLIYWTKAENLGNIAQLGFIIEIIVFSMGLGKKNQLDEKEKKIAQDSFINQLRINEKLIEDQKYKLELKVTERTKELKASKEIAEKNARVKEEFLSVMSHEIRTPMNAIVGLTHMLKTGVHDSAYEENLTTLRYSVDNLMSLINNVLDYNKISAGKIQLEQVDFNLKKIVLSVCHLFKSKADSKGLEFNIFIDESLPEAINGDPFRLSQILNNFLSNAIKFTKEGSISLSVKLLARNEEKISVQFEVSDTGIGIPLEKQNSIFDSFTQVSDDTARKYGGTGLGLTISSDLIKLMGGDVHVTSESGNGCTFVFDTSFKISEGGIGIDMHDRNYSRHKMTNLEDLSVLIVDDNQLNRMVLTKFMDQWNVHSESAENGLIALEKLQENKFDIVLLDLQMPEMDGYEMAKVMSSDKELKKIPIIAISADTISNVYDKVLASGMDDFITKPFNPDELKSKIYSHTSRIK